MGVVVESMWVSVTNWFTPTVLFCILNLTIGTIFISSRFRTSYSKEKHENHEHGREAFLGTGGGTSAPLLFRAPSTLLERVKSINLSFQYRSSDQAPDTDISQEDRGVQHQHEGDEEARELHSESHHVTRRSKSETYVAVPKTTAAEKRKTKMMKKSASEKVVSLEKEKEEEEEKEEAADVVDRRRPATTRERNKPTNVVVDEAVDEKADDFINRFRQQLKLQRLESILRYKEMMNRGAGR